MLDYEEEHRKAVQAGSQRLLELLIMNHGTSAELASLSEHESEPVIDLVPCVVSPPGRVPKATAVAKWLDTYEPAPSTYPPVFDIQRIVARHFQMTRTELISDRRAKYLVHARQIGMYLARELTPRSLPDIGRKFGGRDHTTVFHAISCMKAKLERDPSLAELLSNLKEQIINETNSNLRCASSDSSIGSATQDRASPRSDSERAASID